MCCGSTISRTRLCLWNACAGRQAKGKRWFRGVKKSTGLISGHEPCFATELKRAASNFCGQGHRPGSVNEVKERGVGCAHDRGERYGPGEAGEVQELAAGEATGTGENRECQPGTRAFRG